MVDPDSRQKAIGRMRIACWINKAINTNSNYVIYIAFPYRQWLEESASMLRCNYIACIIIFIFYQGDTFLVLIHGFDKPVNKHVYSSSRLFAATWLYVKEILTNVTVLQNPNELG